MKYDIRLNVCRIDLLGSRPLLLVLGIRLDVLSPGLYTPNLDITVGACQVGRFPFLALAISVTEVSNPFVCDVGHCS